VRKIRAHVWTRLTSRHYALRRPLHGIEAGIVILGKVDRCTREPDELVLTPDSAKITFKTRATG